jgi:hypothetical protein
MEANDLHRGWDFIWHRHTLLSIAFVSMQMRLKRLQGREIRDPRDGRFVRTAGVALCCRIESQRASFSLLLPLAALAAWIELVAIPVALAAYGFHQAAQESDRIRIHTGRVEITLPARRWIPFAMETVSLRHWRVVAAANLPGDLIGTLLLLPMSWPSAWHPAALTLDAWRTLSYPSFCLPAWWFVWRGLDGLLGRKRLHWAALLTGSILALLFLAAFLGFCFGMSSSERAEAVWAIWGFGIWTVAFGVLPMAWLHQRRSDARQRS